ncbi:MAG: hypothetical protein AABX16_02940 [Nanoarchaeota archaeon]
MVNSKNLHKLNERSIREGYEIIKESIEMHRLYCEKIVHAIIWDNVVFKKRGGIKILEDMLEQTTSPKEQEEIKNNLIYWQRNYADIREKVYQFD